MNTREWHDSAPRFLRLAVRRWLAQALLVLSLALPVTCQVNQMSSAATSSNQVTNSEQQKNWQRVIATVPTDSVVATVPTDSVVAMDLLIV